MLIIFIWGPPQPEHSTGVSLGLEDATPIDKSGKTVAEYNHEVKKRKRFYTILSRFGLLLIMVGFAFQLWAIWLPERKVTNINISDMTKKIRTSNKINQNNGPN